MRNLKKFLAVLVVVVMIATTIVPAFAADSYTYTDQAQKLYDLNLFQGLSDTTYEPGLGLALDRQTGVVMLLRLIGKEAAATAMSDADATAALANFTDKGDVVDWAQKSLAYAVKNGLVEGMSSTLLGPKTNLSGKMYATMILRNLGYTVNDTTYATAAALLAEKGGLTAAQAVSFNDKALIRDDLVGMSFGALQAKYSTGTTIIDKLVADGVVTADKAVAAGVSSSITALANPADISVIVGGTITLPTTVTATLSNASTKDVTVTWDKTVDANIVGTTTLTGTVAGTTLTAALKVIVNQKPFVVESVTQISPAAIKVTFSRNVDKVSGTNLANYKVNDIALNSGSSIFGGSSADTKAALSNNVITIYSGDSGKLLTNNMAFNFEVANVLDTSYTVVPTYKTVVYGNDTTAPAVVSVTASAGVAGTTSITAVFSESVYPGGLGTYRINGISATPTKKTGKDSHKVALVTGQTLMPGTEYTLVASGASDGINVASTSTINFTVTNDNVAPTVVSAIQMNSKIQVTFDKSISASELAILNRDIDYYIYKTGMGSNYITGMTVNADDDKKVDITFDQSTLFTGTATSATVEFMLQNVKDTASNIMAAPYKVALMLVKDITPPTLTSAILNTANNANITLTFSEPVTVASDAAIGGITVLKSSNSTDQSSVVYNSTGPVYAANTLVKADGTTVASGTTSSQYVKLTLLSALGTGSAYTFYVPEGTWSDESGNKLAVTSFTVTPSTIADSTKPTVVSAVAALSGGQNVITVTFSEKMNIDDVLNVGNYALDGVGLPAGTQIINANDSNRLVFYIKLPKEGTDASNDVAFSVFNVKDNNGNVINTVSNNITLADTKKPTLVTAEANAANKLTLTFSENLGDYSTVSENHITITDSSNTTSVVLDINLGTLGASNIQMIGKKLIINNIPNNGDGKNLANINCAYAKLTMLADTVTDQAGNGINAITTNNATIALTDKFVDGTGALASVADLVYSPTNNPNNAAAIMFSFTEPTNRVADGIVKYKVYFVPAVEGVLALDKTALTNNYTPVVYWNRAQIYSYTSAPKAFLTTDFTYFSDGTPVHDFNSSANGHINIRIYVIAEDRAGNTAVVVNGNSAPGFALDIAD